MQLVGKRPQPFHVNRAQLLPCPFHGGGGQRIEPQRLFPIGDIFVMVAFHDADEIVAEPAQEVQAFLRIRVVANDIADACVFFNAQFAACRQDCLKGFQISVYVS